MEPKKKKLYYEQDKSGFFSVEAWPVALASINTITGSRRKTEIETNPFLFDLKNDGCRVVVVR
jgi:hypothetical protein